jgi:hypothetical protein
MRQRNSVRRLVSGSKPPAVNRSLSSMGVDPRPDSKNALP